MFERFFLLDLFVQVFSCRDDIIYYCIISPFQSIK